MTYKSSTRADAETRIGAPSKEGSSAASAGPGMTPGQAAYEEDCRRCPTYEDGSARRSWANLRDYEQDTWHLHPVARVYAQPKSQLVKHSTGEST